MEKIEILPNAVYKTVDVSKLLSLDVITVQKYVREGKIQATLIGNKWYRITGQAVLDFLSDNSTTVLKGIWIDESTGVIECPYCGYRIAIMTQSSRVENGKERERFMKTTSCVHCGKKYRLR